MQKRSFVWNYFQIVDKMKGVASCNQCQALISYRSSISNFKQHLRKRHGQKIDYKTGELEELDIEVEKSIPKEKVIRVKSEVWQYFEDKDGDSTMATCSMCLIDVPCNDDQYLTDHMRNMHNVKPKTQDKEGEAPEQDDDSSYKDDSDADSTDGDGDDDVSLRKLSRESRGRKRTSAVWKYFEVRDQEKKVAECMKCRGPYSYRSSISDLMKHVHRKHNDDRSSDDEAGSATEVNEKETARKKYKIDRLFVSRGQRSVLWLYFKCIDPENKVSQCLMCEKKLSYSTTITNLKKHLNSKHPNVKIPAKENGLGNLMKHVHRKHNDDRSSDDEAGSATEVDERDTELKKYKIDRPFVSRGQRSVLWLYFKCIDPENKVSQCLMCEKKLSYSTTITNLKKHLKSKHPNVKIPAKENGRKRILMSSGGQLYEVETESKNGDDIGDLIDAQADTVEMDTVFLEDCDNLPVEKPSKKKKKRYSSSSDEEIAFLNRYVKKHSDSFDHFGKYVASLLRKLPKDTSSQLQADFVKQIMNAKPEEATDSVSQLFESEVNK